jgi:tetratricopeptide (TPR) repeat protein
MSYFMEDDYPHAIEALEPPAGGEQNNLEFLFLRGISHGKMKREQDSEKAFNQSVRVGGDTAHLHFLLGKAYRDLYYLKDAIAIEPGLASFHYQLGQAYLKAGRRAEAEKEMATAENLQAEAREKQERQLSGKMPSPPPPAPKP